MPLYLMSRLANSLFAVVWHRNHLGVISANPLTGLSDIYTYNFSNGEGKALNGLLGHKLIDTGVWGMMAGDANGSGEVNGDDLLIWENEAGQADYRSGDFNMNSEVNNPDKNGFWLSNSGATCQVPE